MDDKTLAALKQSIEKWERNAVAEAPEDYTIGTKTCALCALFFRRGACTECPVKSRTGRRSCVGTPYDVAVSAGLEWRETPSDPTLRDTAHAAARDEVAFLQSLLPKEA